MAGDYRSGVIAAAYLFDQRIELAQYCRESVEEFLAFGRHHKGAFGAIDEFHTEEFLEVLNALARGALGHAMLDGRLRETSLSHHVVKDLERPNVDRLARRLFICFTNFESPSIKIRDSGYRLVAGSSRVRLRLDGAGDARKAL